jgi:hypothetical protein
VRRLALLVWALALFQPACSGDSPNDVGATVYQARGVDPETEIRDSLNRPWRLNAGRPIQALFQNT